MHLLNRVIIIKLVKLSFLVTYYMLSLFELRLVIRNDPSV